MRRSDHTISDDLRQGLEALVCQQAAFLACLDWQDAEQIALAEKRGRIIQVHRGNVEKTLGMDDNGQKQRNPDDPFNGDTEALKRELERRLLRHAQALGTEELLRRVRARGLTPPALGLEIFGEARPEGPEG
ncbi:hypothetical protein [Parvularcula lutaonensis]|uniref:Uncharacterized protein n=1 Tax=Parvularcula lutaonensis TaxID=491923 RepID=A0ABV7ME92_9PROT|nr:hypothetical protein [Parvularcula lutaonensis]GGY53149.1 hypothetical protein GCM10007148_22970 [Parvularcula lutaonensis]